MKSCGWWWVVDLDYSVSSGPFFEFWISYWLGPGPGPESGPELDNSFPFVIFQVINSGNKMNQRTYEWGLKDEIFLLFIYNWQFSFKYL